MFVFAEIQPRWPTSADPIRVCSAADRRAQTWDGQVWLAALHDPGSLSLTLFDGDFGRDLETGASAIVISEKALEEAGGTDHRDVRWESASVSIWSGNFTTAPGVGSYPYANDVALRFVGRVSRFEKDGNSLKLTLSSAGEAGDTDVLNLEYAGTGDEEGGADKKGVLKPWVFGAAKNVEPVLIDEDNSVYQFSAYGPIKAVTALYERGASFGAATGDHASYAALVAATIPAGRWATCLAEGMVRLGAPQFGVITGDIEGDYFGSVFRRKPGAILQRIAAARGISSAQIDTDSLDALDTFAATLPGGGNINFELKSQTSFLALARRLCSPFNAQAGFSLLGELFACRIGIGTPTFTLDSRGRRLPLVSSMIEGDTPPPFSRMVMAADYSHREHDLSTEVAFYATPRPAGDYDAAETYREGDVVSLPDGSTWLYINPTATAGNYPPTSGAYWSQLSGAIEAASNFTLASVADVEIVSPTRVRSAGGAGPWDKKARIVQGGTAASITFTPSTTGQTGGGLTTDPEADASYISVDYWLHNNQDDGNLNVWRNGAFVATIGSASTAPLTVTSDGVTVRYYQGGVLLYSHAVNTTGETVYGVLNLDGPSLEITDVAYSVNGVAGVSPPLITLATTHNTFRYDSDDAPLAQTTTLKATRQNTAGVTEWRYLDASGTPQTTWLSGAGMVAAFGADSSPDNDTLILNQARFEATIDAYGSTGIIVETRISTAPSVQSRVSLVKVADGADAIVVTALPSHANIATDDIGVVNSDQLPRDVQFRAMVGDADVTATATWDLEGSPTGCAVTNEGAGLFRFQTIAAEDGEFSVTAVSGVKTGRGRATFAKNPAGAPAQRSSATGLGTPTASYAPATGVLSLNIAPDVDVNMSMFADYDATGTGTTRIDARLMYRNVTDGGAWTQAGSTLVGSNATNTGGPEPELTPGSVGGTRSIPVPLSTKVYEFRVEWIRVGTTLFVAGSGMQVSIS